MRIHVTINNLLTIFVLAFALYLLIVPALPQISWLFRDKSTGAPYVGVLSQATERSSRNPQSTPADNRIVIPSALIDEPIYFGSDISVIDDGGSWLKEINTRSPKEDGNTVIVGHRFTYQKPEGAFYHLDKVNQGDELALYWQGEELLYKIVEKKVVPADAVEVEGNSSGRKLTLYTCTPLITAENRLVLIAGPLGESR